MTNSIEQAKQTPRLILHIGRHKSGTTAIQDVFARDRAALERAGIDYPSQWLSGTAHHALAKRCKDGDLAEVKAIWRALRASAAAKGCSTTLVSSEYFQTIKHLPTLACARDVFDEIKVVCYVRNLIDYFSSTYQQHVYATALTEPVSARVDKFKYRHMSWLSRLKQSFDDDLLVRVFDRDHLVNGDIVEDFCRTVDMPFNVLGPSGEANLSITGNLLLFKLVANRGARGRNSEAEKAMLQRLARLDPSYRGRFRLPRHVFDKLYERFAEDTEQVREVFRLDLRLPDLPSGRAFEADRWDDDLDLFIKAYEDAGMPLAPVADLKADGRSHMAQYDA